MGLGNKELRKAGLKVTLPRVRIYQILEQASESDHWSAEDIHKRLMERGEDFGLATIYRVLTQFENAGLVVRHHFEGGYSVFELATEDMHDHIVCVRTGKIREFSDSILNERIKEIALEMGYDLVSRTIYLYGIVQDQNKE